MRYCLNLPNGGACGDPRTLAEFAAVAEDAGWDAVFLEDYIVYQSREDIPTFDPWVSLAAMAMQTERIRLGTMVTPLARRRPWKVARETVTLDHLSGGRLILGVGLGAGMPGHPPDSSFTHFGETDAIRERASMLDEALDVLAGLWSGERFSYDGTHFTVRETTFLPRPAQTPRIPIWVGGAYPNRGPLRRAARWDGACLYKATAPGSSEDSNEPLTPDEVRALKAFVERRRPASAPFDIMVSGRTRHASPGHDRERIQASAAAGATWAQEWTPPADEREMRAYIAQGPLRID